MNSVLEVLFLRRPSIDYISCPVCEFDFSSSGGPVIVLEALGRLLAPSGFVLGGRGRFRLSWNHYPGALCYTVYKAVDSNNPNGEYVVVAECIEDPEIDLEPHGPGCYRVSAITENGETELSDPICEVGECPFILSGASPEFQSKPATDSADITAEVGNSGEAEFYHWYKDGVFYRDTTGTTTSNLTISPLALSDSGFYTLRVGNVDCEDESAPSQLQVTSVGGHDPIAFWKMDAVAGDPVDEVGGFVLNFDSGVPGIAGAPGKILNSFIFSADTGPGGFSTACRHQTSVLPALAPTGNGAEFLSWLQFNVVTPAGLTECKFNMAYALITDSDIAILGLLYDLLNNPGFLTISFGGATLSVPFVHTLGDWHFYRVRYNASTGKVGFSFDNGALTESVSTHFLAGTGVSGIFEIGASAGPFSQMVVKVDELGVFDLAMSDVEAGTWWNGGAGRTYP